MKIIQLIPIMVRPTIDVYNMSLTMSTLLKLAQGLKSYMCDTHVGNYTIITGGPTGSSTQELTVDIYQAS